MRLGQWFGRFDCDKFSHCYYTEYEKTIPQDDPINILEIGVWRGNSTIAFHNYNKNAVLYGIDIFTRNEMKDVQGYENENVHLLKADSTDSDLAKKLVEEFGDIEFDIIIDDGKHTPESNMKTFNNLFDDFLAPYGIYYIEDVWPLHLMNEKELQNPWLIRHKNDYIKEKHDALLERISQYHFEEIDLRRKSGKPDSYLIKVMK